MKGKSAQNTVNCPISQGVSPQQSPPQRHIYWGIKEGEEAQGQNHTGELDLGKEMSSGREKSSGRWSERHRSKERRAFPR